MDETEQALMEELENAETAMDAGQHGNSGESVNASETAVEAGSDAEAAKSDILEKLDNKKKELVDLLFFASFKLSSSARLLLLYGLENLPNSLRVQWKKLFKI
jgi:hypothetical protein